MPLALGYPAPAVRPSPRDGLLLAVVAASQFLGQICLNRCVRQCEVIFNISLNSECQRLIGMVGRWMPVRYPGLGGLRCVCNVDSVQENSCVRG